LMSVQECSICLCEYSADNKEENKTPLLLSCGHTFCYSCLVDIYDDEKALFECPTCRGHTKASQGIKDLKSNFALLEMLSLFSESKKIKKPEKGVAEVGADGKEGTVCCECEKANATLYCPSCEESYCAECCQSTHQASKALSKHRPRPITLQTHASKCLDHNEPIKLLCRTCSIPICALCTHKDYGTIHQGHETVLIKTAAPEIQTSIATLLAQSDNALQTLNDTSESIAKSITTLSTNSELISKKISKTIEDTIQALRLRETELVKLLAEEEKYKSNKLLGQKEVIQGRITNLGKQCEQLRETIGHELDDNDVSILIAQSKLIKTLAHDLNIEYEKLPLVEPEMLVDLPDLGPTIKKYGTIGQSLPTFVTNLRSSISTIYLRWDASFLWTEFVVEMRLAPGNKGKEVKSNEKEEKGEKEENKEEKEEKKTTTTKILFNWKIPRLMEFINQRIGSLYLDLHHY